jgi:hypothetical protein
MKTETVNEYKKREKEVWNKEQPKHKKVRKYDGLWKCDGMMWEEQGYDNMQREL